MSGVQWPVFLVLTILLTFIGGDSEVCLWMDSCILPCRFQPGDEVVIHWKQVAGSDILPGVHSYYYADDQLSGQDQRFLGRTSLFKEHISRGNASLKLTGVEVLDRGRYMCYTSTLTGNKKSYIEVNVEAPVRKVDIQQVGDRITCSSEGIYPEPELAWSTSPPSNVTPPGKATVQVTEKLLYNISSSLIRADDVTDLVYSCAISTDRYSRRATLYKASWITGPDTERTIPCTASHASLTGLVWRFNHSQVILEKTGTDVGRGAVSEEWRQRVKGVSETGSLTLQGLTPNQDGMYTCELSTHEETHVTNVFLRTEKSQDGPNVAGIIAVVVLSVLAIIVTVLLCVKYKTLICPKLKKVQATESNTTPTESPDVNMGLMENGGGKPVLKEEDVASAGETKDMLSRGTVLHEQG